MSLNIERVVNNLKMLEEWFDFERPKDTYDMFPVKSVLLSIRKNLEISPEYSPAKITPEKSTTMMFGKHKGTPFDEVPSDYLIWVMDNIEESKWDEGLTEYLQENEEYIRADKS